MQPGTRVGFVGLGDMGGPMVRTLLKAGYRVAAVDIRPEAVEAAAAAGAEAAPTPAAAARGAAATFVMVRGDDVVREVIFGADGVLAGREPDAPVVLSSTVYLETVEEIDRGVRAQGGTLLSAPVSGGPPGAAAGMLTTLVTGPADTAEALMPLFETMSRSVFYMGPDITVGLKTKFINNMLVGLNLGAWGEALKLAGSAGIPLQTLADFIVQSAGGSWVMQNWPTQPARRPYVPDGFAQAVALSEELNVDMPILRTALERYSDKGFLPWENDWPKPRKG